MESSILMGEELLFFARVGDDERVSQTLLKALRQHMNSGESMDAILGLSPARGGVKTARRNEILTLRGIQLLCALEKIRDVDPDMSLWDVAGIIHDGLRAGHPDLAPIRELGEQVGLTLSTRESVYRALKNLDPLN